MNRFAITDPDGDSLAIWLGSHLAVEDPIMISVDGYTVALTDHQASQVVNALRRAIAEVRRQQASR